MLIQVALHRGSRNGNYADVVDVADYLGELELGNAANALAQMARDSGKFKTAISSKGFREWKARPGGKKNGRAKDMPAEEVHGDS